MTVANWSKLAVAITAIVCTTALLIAGAISEGAGVPLITLVLGYMLGNGIAAAKNTPVEPIIGPPTGAPVPGPSPFR